jgi:nitric oxide reductase subunit B
MQQPIIHLLVWLRVPGDTIFSIGAVAMAWFVLRLWIGPRQVTTRVPAGTPAVERSRALPR